MEAGREWNEESVVGRDRERRRKEGRKDEVEEEGEVAVGCWKKGTEVGDEVKVGGFVAEDLRIIFCGSVVVLYVAPGTLAQMEKKVESSRRRAFSQKPLESRVSVIKSLDDAAVMNPKETTGGMRRGPFLRNVENQLSFQKGFPTYISTDTVSFINFTHATTQQAE